MIRALLAFATLLCLSSNTVAQPPYSGTLFVDPDVLVVDDPSNFVVAVPAGTGSRQMFDRRVNDWVVLQALLFTGYFTDGSRIEIQVNPEFSAQEAAEKAAFYGHAIGQLPTALRLDVQTVWIHKGDQPFGGGNNNLLIHTEATGYHGKWLEETLFHEACHTSLDSRVANSQAWLTAQTTDPEFISTYARDNPQREDVAETCLMQFALRHRPDRISDSNAAIINGTIPNRLAVLDTLDIKPIGAADRVAAFDAAVNQLSLPAVAVGPDLFSVTLALVDADNLVFGLQSAIASSAPNYSAYPGFAQNMLTAPLILVGAERYSVTFNLIGDNPVRLQVIAAELLP